MNVCCAETGSAIATACTNLDPTPQAQWHLLTKAMVFPLSASISPQIPGMVIVANRLRKNFTEFKVLVSDLTTVTLQQPEDERRNAEANGTDPDGYNFNKQLLKGPYKLPAEYKEKISESEDEESMVTDSTISQEAAKAEMAAEAMEIERHQDREKVAKQIS